MSTHKNPAKDIPDRCLELLDLSKEAKDKDLEVTLLLAAAALAIVMPLERFNILRNERPNVLDDSRTRGRACGKLTRICHQYCDKSPLFSRADLIAWRYTMGSSDEVVGKEVQDSKTESIQGQRA